MIETLEEHGDYENSNPPDEATTRFIDFIMCGGQESEELEQDDSNASNASNANDY